MFARFSLCVRVCQLKFHNDKQKTKPFHPRFAERTVQLLQLPDGQTFLYQPMQTVGDSMQSQPQIININGNLIQLPSTNTTQSLNGQQQSPMMMLATAASSTSAQNSNTGGEYFKYLVHLQTTSVVRQFRCFQLLLLASLIRHNSTYVKVQQTTKFPSLSY